MHLEHTDKINAPFNKVSYIAVITEIIVIIYIIISIKNVLLILVLITYQAISHLTMRKM